MTLPNGKIVQQRFAKAPAFPLVKGQTLMESEIEISSFRCPARSTRFSSTHNVTGLYFFAVTLAVTTITVVVVVNVSYPIIITLTTATPYHATVVKVWLDKAIIDIVQGSRGQTMIDASYSSNTGWNFLWYSINTVFSRDLVECECLIGTLFIFKEGSSGVVNMFLCGSSWIL